MNNIATNILKLKNFIDEHASNLQPVIIPSQCQTNRKDKNYNSIEHYCVTPEQQLECEKYLKYMNNLYDTTFITAKDICMKSTIDFENRIIFITGYINNSDYNLIKTDKETNNLTEIMSKLSSNAPNSNINSLKEHFNEMNGYDKSEAMVFEQVYNSAFALNVLLSNIPNMTIQLSKVEPFLYKNGEKMSDPLMKKTKLKETSKNKRHAEKLDTTTKDEEKKMNKANEVVDSDSASETESETESIPEPVKKRRRKSKK